MNINLLIILEFTGFIVIFIIGVIYYARAEGLLISHEPQIKISQWFVFQFFGKHDVFYIENRYTSHDRLE